VLTPRACKRDLIGEFDMSIVTRRSLILSGAGLATAAFVVPAEAATGSVSLHIASAGFIFGVTGGSGTLTFRGQQFPLRIGGISAGALVGISATDLVGTASNLHSPGDIAGIYSAVGAGLSIAGGRSNAQLVNANGVRLRLHGRQVGFSFSIDLSGMSISIA
jgi:lipid-binding SYLF domain-containing protein